LAWWELKPNNWLRRSNADKRKAVELALQHPSGAKLSDRQIAEHVGVDHKTVGRYRAELYPTGELPQSTSRQGRNGRTINTANIRRGKSPKPNIGDPLVEAFEACDSEIELEPSQTASD